MSLLIVVEYKRTEVLGDQLSWGALELDQLFQEGHGDNGLKVKDLGLHLLLFACRKICLNKVDQVEDVLLELAMVELAEDTDQTDDKVRSINQELFLLPREIEDYSTILQLIKGIQSQDCSGKREKVEVFH